jgi:hypothetical protein
LVNALGSTFTVAGTPVHVKIVVARFV